MNRVGKGEGWGRGLAMIYGNTVDVNIYVVKIRIKIKFITFFVNFILYRFSKLALFTRFQKMPFLYSYR